jgi:hypothetical protein
MLAIAYLLSLLLEGCRYAWWPVLFVYRLMAATAWLTLECSGIGRCLYRLPRNIPRDRREATANPKSIFRLAQAGGAIPPEARFLDLSLHDANVESMSDPDKLERTFLVTITFVVSGEESTVVDPGEVTLCIKTGRFRGPFILQCLIAAGGFFSREKCFYEDVAPHGHGLDARVPRCFHADSIWPLTHTFFILEGVTGVVCRRESAPYDDTTARAFLAAEAKVHSQFWDAPSDAPPLAALRGSVFGGVLGVLPKQQRPLMRAVVAYTHKRCGQGLVHGDSRLGNALFGESHEVTLVDWEVAQCGPCLFDVLYFLWLCVDGEKEEVEADEHVYGLFSARDWALLSHWQHELRIPPSTTHGTLQEQVCVVSLLLAGYFLAIGKLGFGAVWKDGNNRDDMDAWGRRVRQRLEALCNNRRAIRVAARAIEAEVPAPDGGGWETHLIGVLDQAAKTRRVWAEQQDSQPGASTNSAAIRKGRKREQNVSSATPPDERCKKL